MENQSIAKNLVYQRKLKGYSQEELSENTKVTVRTIQRIEKGEVNPHLQTVKLLANALEIEVDDLLVIENPKEETIQKKWLLLMHGTPIIGLILPLCNILFPLFLWIHKREDNKLYDTHGRKIINFQITMTILFLASFIALITIKGIGFFLFISVIPYTLIVIIINVVSAINSQRCFYPLAIPFLKRNNNERSKILSVFIIICAFSFNSYTTTSIDAITRLDGSAITKDSLTAKIGQLIHGEENFIPYNQKK